MINPNLKKISRIQSLEAHDYSLEESAVPKTTFKSLLLKSLFFVGLLSAFALVVFFLGYYFIFSNKSGLTPDQRKSNLVIFSIVSLSAFGLMFLFSLLGNFVSIARFSVWVYSIASGVFIGAITLVFEMILRGVGVIALSATAFVFLTVLLLNLSNKVRATRKLYKVMLFLGLTVLLMSLINLVLWLVFRNTGNQLYSNTTYLWLQIALSAVYILYLTIVLTFSIEGLREVAQNEGLEKGYSYVAILGLISTLTWMYIEFLRLAVIVALLFASKATD